MFPEGLAAFGNLIVISQTLHQNEATPDVQKYNDGLTGNFTKIEQAEADPNAHFKKTLEGNLLW